jgi:hypothetical protein
MAEVLRLGSQEVMMADQAVAAGPPVFVLCGARSGSTDTLRIK